MDSLELFAHPVRLRIIHALRGGRMLTTSQLCERIPDASKATVYRHVDQLAGAGVLEVAEERRVRGAVERGYRLRQENASVDAETLASLTADDHRHAFTAAMATLIAEFSGYLDQAAADPVADLVGYRQHGIWLSLEELTTLIGALQQAIVPLLGNEPAPERARYLLSPILFPVEQPESPS
ncbi:DNA-binding transcriptional ArsR family regulator [Streptacidiphilus sp. BW17]|jgi:DNA-binding transcriptional ArsR family regulator|uniref:helix-turn-helix domain-containing protein n=1 Tax=Streptacidiphilus sp. BW17 TaxID=3156274 RepID=UPI003514213F